MKFDNCIEAHAEWKLRLRITLDSDGRTDLDPDEVGADDRCDLGAWLRGHGRTFAGEPMFESLTASHREFHRVAALAIRKAASGNRMEAEAILAGEYARLSATVVNCLVELRQRTEDGTAGS